MKAWRIGLALAGVSLVAYGVFRLLSEVPWRNLVFVGTWLLAALVIHDALVAPATLGVGWLLRRAVPDRERRYLQSGLIVGAVVTVIAVPMIYLRGSQPAVKAILLQNYGANLALILVVVAVVTTGLYLLRVMRDRRASVVRGGRA